jgi:hypothetical protein
MLSNFCVLLSECNRFMTGFYPVDVFIGKETMLTSSCCFNNMNYLFTHTCTLMCLMNLTQSLQSYCLNTLSGFCSLVQWVCIFKLIDVLPNDILKHPTTLALCMTVRPIQVYTWTVQCVRVHILLVSLASWVDVH